jgi:hypothetical protein
MAKQVAASKVSPVSQGTHLAPFGNADIPEFDVAGDNVLVAVAAPSVPEPIANRVSMDDFYVPVVTREQALQAFWGDVEQGLNPSKAAAKAPRATAQRYGKVLGKYSLIKLLHLMGKQGWSKPCASYVLGCLGISNINPATLSTGLTDGRNPKYCTLETVSEGDLATLNQLRAQFIASLKS